MNIGEISFAKPISTVAQLIDQAEQFDDWSRGDAPRKFAFRGQPQEFNTLGARRT
jgi:hypothetical protein